MSPNQLLVGWILFPLPICFSLQTGHSSSFPVAQMYLHFSFDRTQCALQHTLWWTSGQKCSDPFHHVSKNVFFFFSATSNSEVGSHFQQWEQFYVCVTFTTFMPRQMQPSRPNQWWWMTRTRPLQHLAATLPTLLLPSRATIGPIMARPLTNQSQPLEKHSLNTSMFLNLM